MNLFPSKSIKKTSIFTIFAVFSAFLGIFSTSSCSKSGASEKEQMISFAQKNNITYTEDASGILYQIIAAGTGTKPAVTNTVTVTYTGTLMNGTTFDAGTISYPLSSLIQGWQIAVPKIAPGGEIKVLIPSSLAYGSQSVGSIPANSPLYFDIKLSAVK